MYPLKYTLLLWLLATTAAHAKTPDSAASEVDSLIEAATWASKRGHFDDVAATARRLLAADRQKNDPRARLYGLIYTGHSLAREVDDSVKWYYGQANRLAAAMHDYRALAAINNALAIYTSEMEMNYLSGMSYFLEALKWAERSPDRQSYPVILNNLAMAHYLRNDPGGLKYSLEVIERGEAAADPFLIYSGSFVTAYMHYLLGDYATALAYMERALESGGAWVEYAEAYSLYANILVKVGREREAVDYYERSLDEVGDEKSNTLAYLNYGSYLTGEGRAQEAIAVLNKGLDFADKRNNAFYRYQLYEKLSEAYASSGQTLAALDYYRRYHEEFVAIFDVERERAISELRVRYESEKQEKELREKELDLLRQKKRLEATLFLVVLLSGALVVLLVSNRRRNLRYRQIVRQQHELIEKERVIEQLGVEEAAQPSGGKEAALFQRIQKLMSAEKIYREPNITIDKVAERLGTNRSYLSRAINEQGGMSFSQYVLSFRIDEARRILSDAGNDIQIKLLAYELGFATPETFSSSFRKAIGMLPSKFREQIRKLYAEQAQGSRNGYDE